MAYAFSVTTGSTRAAARAGTRQAAEAASTIAIRMPNSRVCWLTAYAIGNDISIIAGRAGL